MSRRRLLVAGVAPSSQCPCAEIFKIASPVHTSPVHTCRQYMRRRCISEHKCRNTWSRSGYWKMHNGSCIQECPSGYMVEELDTNRCRKCSGRCPISESRFNAHAASPQRDARGHHTPLPRTRWRPTPPRSDRERAPLHPVRQRTPHFTPSDGEHPTSPRQTENTPLHPVRQKTVHFTPSDG